MAEFVQRDIEEMLPEMESLRKSNIFSTEETRSIMKQRKRYEYKMQRRTKEKEVYLQYIQYEINVLDLIKQRRQKRKIDSYEDQIEKPIMLRIYKLFRIACFRFKSDIKLWLTYIDFAKKRMDKNRVSKTFTTMLQIHNKKPSLWIMAAKYEFEVGESIETARQLFQRALRFLPQSKKLWLEYFKMELLCAEVVRKRREFLGINEKDDDESSDPIEDAILSCKIAEVVFKNAIRKVNDDPYFIQSFVVVAKDFSFTKDLIDFIYKTLNDSESFKNTEEAWDILARKQLIIEEKKILKECEESGQNADFTIASFEQAANSVYLEAVEKLNTEKMWLIYIDFCFERLNLKSKYLNEERFDRLNDVLMKARSHIKLPLELYVKWIENSNKHMKLNGSLEILDESLNYYSKSVDLWKFKLNQSISTELSQEEILKLFQTALDSVKGKETPVLWDLILKWCFANKIDVTENLLENGSNNCYKEVAIPIRVKYLDWSFQTGGEKKVREIYEKYYQIPPYDVEFYLNYINKEQCFKNVSITNIGKAYEEAIKHFGNNSVELWLEYIKFKHYNKSDNVSDVSEIYWKALKQLQEHLVDEFNQKFNLLKIKLENASVANMDTSDID